MYKIALPNYFPAKDMHLLVVNYVTYQLVRKVNRTHFHGLSYTAVAWRFMRIGS